MSQEPQWVSERRKRNIALGVVLGAIATLFFIMSIVKWAQHTGHQ